MTRQKILITGAAGFIGSSLLERLIQEDKYFVVAFDDLSTGKLGNLPAKNSQWEFINSDANDYQSISKVMFEEKFDYVFHYAAVVGVKRTLAHPLKVLEDIEGFKHILQLSQKTGVKRIFFSSSSEVYGEPVEIPQHEETTPLNAKLPYAVVKNVGEVFIKSYHKEFGLDYTTLRFFNTYGPKQSDDFVISKFIKQAKNNQDITIYGDGKQTRTFCYVDDNIDVTVKMLQEDSGINETLNIGSDVMINMVELAKLIIELTHSKSKIIHVSALPEGDMTRRQPDNRKMEKILGKELLGLREGLERILKIKDFLSNF